MKSMGHRMQAQGLTRVPTSGSKGFTLIELLVVIAIIGLLASIILASLNTAQQKGRDARRVSDLQEIGQAMIIQDAGTAVNITGCSNGTALSTCTGVTSLSGYNDPSSNSATGFGTTKPTASTGVNNYTIYFTGTATTKNYEVCDVLEIGSGSLAQGPIYVASSTGGAILAGCP